MRNHVRVQFHLGVDVANAPFWGDVIRDKSGAMERLEPSVDRVLERYRMPVLATREYHPETGGHWNEAEVASGLDRVYRLVLMERGGIPEGLIRDLRLLPVVQSAEPGRVASAELPQMARAMRMERRTGMAARETIYLHEAHEVTRGDPSITVAVLDTGVALLHPELRHAMLPGYDCVDILDGAREFFGDYLDADESPDDEVGHGTHVTGIIAARGEGMPMGVVPRCRVLPVRVLGALKQGSGRWARGWWTTSILASNGRWTTGRTSST